jgi:Mg2+ and Co2+ transporter CorA
MGGTILEKIDTIIDILKKEFSEGIEENEAYKISKHQRQYFIDMLTAYISMPTLVLAFYGMNVKIPGMTEKNGIVIVILAISIWVIFVRFYIQPKYPYPSKSPKLTDAA